MAEIPLEPAVVERIRSIFLQQRPHVSIAEGTVLLGWTRGEMSEAISAGEIEVERTCLDVWIWREELMAKALEGWSLEQIDGALGDDAGRVLPSSMRLIDLHVRLPRYHVAMLEQLAERARTTVSSALARELDGVPAGMPRGRPSAASRRRCGGRMGRERRRRVEGLPVQECVSSTIASSML